MQFVVVVFGQCDVYVEFDFGWCMFDVVFDVVVGLFEGFGNFDLLGMCVLVGIMYGKEQCGQVVVYEFFGVFFVVVVVIIGCDVDVFVIE